MGFSTSNIKCENGTAKQETLENQKSKCKGTVQCSLYGKHKISLGGKILEYLKIFMETDHVIDSVLGFLVFHS